MHTIQWHTYTHQPPSPSLNLPSIFRPLRHDTSQYEPIRANTSDGRLFSSLAWYRYRIASHRILAYLPVHPAQVVRLVQPSKSSSLSSRPPCRSRQARLSTHPSSQPARRFHLPVQLVQLCSLPVYPSIHPSSLRAQLCSRSTRAYARIDTSRLETTYIYTYLYMYTRR